MIKVGKSDSSAHTQKRAAKKNKLVSVLKGKFKYAGTTIK